MTVHMLMDSGWTWKAFAKERGKTGKPLKLIIKGRVAILGASILFNLLMLMCTSQHFTPSHLPVCIHYKGTRAPLRVGPTHQSRPTNYEILRGAIGVQPLVSCRT